MQTKEEVTTMSDEQMLRIASLLERVEGLLQSRPEPPCKQMKLTRFMREYDVEKRIAYEWIHIEGFPAYKIGGRWYVDIPEYLKWREKRKYC